MKKYPSSKSLRIDDNRKHLPKKEWPSVGRTLLYTLSAVDAEQVNRRRVLDASQRYDWPAGAQAHVGDIVEEGQILPLIVTGCHDDVVSGQVLLPGNDTLWVTYIQHGDGLGTWHWPVRS